MKLGIFDRIGIVKTSLSILLFSTVLLAESSPLFTLERSTNTNQVVYEMIHEGCVPNPKTPIHPYWVMNTKKGTREELTGIEKRRAYGVKILSTAKDKVVFSLKAVSKKSLTGKCLPGESNPVAVTLIQGKESILKTVYVKTEGPGIIPRVVSITLSGIDLSTQQKVQEIIEN